MRQVHIIALGDSTTAGTPGWKSPLESPPDGAGDETSQYAYWLAKAEPGWDVLNRGVNGERTDEILARFDRDVGCAVEVKATVVVIIAGVNDIYQGRSAQHVIEHLRSMYDRARNARIAVVAGTIVPYNTATPGQNARMREANAWIRTWTRDHEMGFADTRAAVAAPGDPDRLFDSPDELHPTPEGYRRMANVIREAVHAILRS